LTSVAERRSALAGYLLVEAALAALITLAVLLPVAAAVAKCRGILARVQRAAELRDGLGLIASQLRVAAGGWGELVLIAPFEPSVPIRRGAPAIAWRPLLAPFELWAWRAGGALDSDGVGGGDLQVVGVGESRLEWSGEWQIGEAHDWILLRARDSTVPVTVERQYARTRP
jgi:hypothetical protein